jgi:hypothetical protein
VVAIYRTLTFFFVKKNGRQSYGMNDFKNDVAIALSLSILLWKDATPTASFPNTDELVKIELGRVLAHPHIFRELPWLRARVNPIYGALMSEPWDVDPPNLLERYTRVLTNPTEFELVGRAIKDMSFADPTFDIIRRHGKRPTATAESMILTARGVANSLRISRNPRVIEDGVKERYHHLYSQLR